MSKSLRALTLTELIIATIIVSVVVGGVLAAEYGLRSTGKQVTGDIQVYLMTRALEDYIRQSVKRVHGDLTTSNSGISIDVSNKTVCFRRDVEVSGTYTPNIYIDDNWHCFTLVGTNVYACDTGTSAGTCDNTGTFSGTLVSDEFTISSTIIPRPLATTAPTTGDYYFDMTLVNRKDPSAGAAVSGAALTSGTAANPQTVVKFRQSPAGF